MVLSTTVPRFVFLIEACIRRSDESIPFQLSDIMFIGVTGRSSESKDIKHVSIFMPEEVNISYEDGVVNTEFERSKPLGLGSLPPMLRMSQVRISLSILLSGFMVKLCSIPFFRPIIYLDGRTDCPFPSFS